MKAGGDAPGIILYVLGYKFMDLLKYKFIGILDIMDLSCDMPQEVITS